MEFQEWLDPHGNKRKQFDRIIDFLATTPRPKTNYRLLSHVDFLGLDFLRHIFEVQTSYMLLFRSFVVMYQHRGYEPEPMMKGYLSRTEILEWNRKLGIRELYEIFCTNPDRSLIGLMADLKLEEPFFHSEFMARLADKPFTAE